MNWPRSVSGMRFKEISNWPRSVSGRQFFRGLPNGTVATPVKSLASRRVSSLLIWVKRTAADTYVLTDVAATCPRLPGVTTRCESLKNRTNEHFIVFGHIVAIEASRNTHGLFWFQGHCLSHQQIWVACSWKPKYTLAEWLVHTKKEAMCQMDVHNCSFHC